MFVKGRCFEPGRGGMVWICVAGEDDGWCVSEQCGPSARAVRGDSHLLDIDGGDDRHSVVLQMCCRRC